jgi:hypothetical protein
MAVVESKYIVRTNAHRKKIADNCATGSQQVTKFTHVVLGDGGKNSSGELKVPNGAVPNLFNQLVKLPITRMERVSDFEYIVHLTVDTSVQTQLVGKDINERGIVDSAGTIAVLETFPGFGVLQANKTYEYAIRFTVI